MLRGDNFLKPDRPAADGHAAWVRWDSPILIHRRKDNLAMGRPRKPRKQRHPQEVADGWGRFWRFLGYTSAIATVCSLVFGVGEYWGYRKAKRHEFRDFATYLEDIRRYVRIIDVTYEPTIAHPGETIHLQVTIANDGPHDYDLWLGAESVARDGTRVWSPEEDRRIDLPARGATRIERPLTLAAATEPSSYDIVVAVWYGRVADPEQSMQISRMSIRDAVKVSAK